MYQKEYDQLLFLGGGGRGGCDEKSYLMQICLSIEDYVIFGSWSQIRKVENDNSMALPLTQGQWKQRCLARNDRTHTFSDFI